MPDVDITNYAGGSTLPRNFTATGTYDPSGVGDPLPVVILEDSDGTLIATGVTTRVSAGIWQSVFTLTRDYDDLSLLATLGSADADEPHMIIREFPTMSINPLPGPPVGGTFAGGLMGAAALIPPAPWPPFDVTGTYAANVAAIIVVAFSYKPNNRVDSILACVPALLDRATMQWKARFTISLPTNRRLVVRAVAVNNKGKILGAVANRAKKA